VLSRFSAPTDEETKMLIMQVSGPRFKTLSHAGARGGMESYEDSRLC
jgi:hypothetical protein